MAAKKAPKPAARKSTKAPTDAALLKKVAGVSETTKVLTREIKSMGKIFGENQKILISMRTMLDSLASAMEQIQRQSRQMEMVEEDTQKLFAGLSQVRAQSDLIAKINGQTARLEEQIRTIQKESGSKLAAQVAESMDSIRNNSQMIIKIAQRVDEVRDSLRGVSARTEAAAGVGPELEGLKAQLQSLAGKIQDADVSTLKEELRGLALKAESVSQITSEVASIRSQIGEISISAQKIGPLEGIIEGLREQFGQISERADALEGVGEKISAMEDSIKRSEKAASEFHAKTDVVFEELRAVRNAAGKSSSDSSAEMMALLKLTEYQSSIRMRSESKYGTSIDLEGMAAQTTSMVNLFDRLSVEAQEKMALPHEVRQWAVSKIFDCADRWEVRFSDVFKILVDSLGRDLLKETVRIQQVRDIYGIRAVDEIRSELGIS